MASDAAGRTFVARHRGDIVTATVALVARMAVVVWAAGRWAPAADGVYYHTLAVRIARGLGSTWAWPDGAVTYAAHYPVGYPALLAAAYRAFGDTVSVAGAVNAVVGTLAALAAYRLVIASERPQWALSAGLAVALHPALVMYTPAVMTEGITAALVATGAWAASGKKWYAAAVVGCVVGAATLVRPQSILLAPLFGALACSSPRARVAARFRGALTALVAALLICAPWTLRNCVRMHRCALVSFNGGWNLLIGSSERATGSFAPIDVPEACRTVWDEAEKDICFGREARRVIAAHPGRFLALVPARLAATFDYSGAPGYYLHASNPDAFGDRAKLLLGAVETVYERFAYLGALAAAALWRGPRQRVRFAVAVFSALLLLQVHAYLAVLGLCAVLGLLGRSLFEGPPLLPATLAALGATAVAHAVFFGAGRYSMVVFPLVTALAFLRGAPSSTGTLTARTSERDTDGPKRRMECP
ncbi:MAG TPA: glycosyltransferase family 39 protein [Polyangiaceae bacterium]|nr:glycosyltransferase family 39 protein [Polyangiaceae bacterium]